MRYSDGEDSDGDGVGRERQNMRVGLLSAFPKLLSIYQALSARQGRVLRFLQHPLRCLFNNNYDQIVLMYACSRLEHF